MVAKILIVDDAAFMRTVLKNFLIKHNFEVVGEAANGEKAVFKYKELRPDLVIMDITMPDMDGLEAVKEIKKSFPEAKIIMCSAMGQSQMILEAIQAGAKDFIVKPFQEDLVIEKIKKNLGM
ncbi:two-component system, chemotaxis family, response regulator CheY [Anaerovirgula multivorans]|uniref:Stage 0 sporulation protein A homolog n=1 Tax=Anaerovirgula multivorans TaxID=312168 RepID=A0A239DC30_9FIRM|nr:response regulator [Anaerovirgula multivorans]SNS29879.1 two-component system, chemotaxis family, response regulator CheY [Anaerovirgula multivorans]